jgi:hypothetical protein
VYRWETRAQMNELIKGSKRGIQIEDTVFGQVVGLLEEFREDKDDPSSKYYALQICFAFQTDLEKANSEYVY